MKMSLLLLVAVLLGELYLAAEIVRDAPDPFSGLLVAAVFLAFFASPICFAISNEWHYRHLS